MKEKFLAIAFSLLVMLASCAKDNYEPPQSDFSGRLVYQGQPIGLRNNAFKLELWQRGFGNFGVINVNVDQDGGFSSKLFDGNYKFTVSNGQVPFLWPKNTAGRPDSLDINLAGNKSMDLEVRPYYMIRNATITAAGGKVNATCALEKIITDADGKNLDNVTLFINKTQFVDADGTNNIGKQELSGAALTNLSSLSMSVDIPTISPTQNYVFARIGVKIAGIEHMVFSPLVKLTF